jgi:hypothetical protein
MSHPRLRLSHPGSLSALSPCTAAAAEYSQQVSSSTEEKCASKAVETVENRFLRYISTLPHHATGARLGREVSHTARNTAM